MILDSKNEEEIVEREVVSRSGSRELFHYDKFAYRVTRLCLAAKAESKKALLVQKYALFQLRAGDVSRSEIENAIAKACASWGVVVPSPLFNTPLVSTRRVEELSLEELLFISECIVSAKGV